MATLAAEYQRALELDPRDSSIPTEIGIRTFGFVVGVTLKCLYSALGSIRIT